ncbi:hypothetical protein HDV05_006377 [Chytridiales sp. JEL 0842]|nr:hypothetical protein HDV05_006377 [Chytridiales sp. JEL 0842]
MLGISNEADLYEGMSEYEKERAMRLAENKRQLAMLLGDELKKETKPKQEAPKPPRAKPKRLQPLEPARKSNRLQGKAEEYKGLSYDVDRWSDDEVDGDMSDKAFIDDSENPTAGKLPIYRKPPPGMMKKKRGAATRVNRGGRIYDSINGTSCHQCRQKTLDPKVQCTNMITYGTAEGTTIQARCPLMLDELCLSGRYGETLEEARANENWICPKCRDICNCSFCMQKRGKGPTGQLKAIALAKGFKGVSDYLASKGEVLPRARKVQAILVQSASSDASK